MDALSAWLGLWLAPKLSQSKRLTLLTHYHCPLKLIENLDGPELSWIGATTRAFLKSPDPDLIERYLRFQSVNHQHLISLGDPRYPELLKAIADPPLMLCVIGNAEHLKDPQIAIVGSRQMTHYGKQVTERFTQELSTQGLTITSGLARGVDSQAHRSALLAKGATIAIMGTGIDLIYPREHQKLAQQIAEHGCLVSAFPLGTPPCAHTFPRRNRIITGLSLGTLIVEAGLKSGSLISARLAMEQNREVFVIPGAIDSPLSHGCHLLAQQGAKLVQSSDEILIELQAQLAPYLKPHDSVLSHQAHPLKKIPPCSFSEAETALLCHLGSQSVSSDQLLEWTSYPSSMLFALLVGLELKGAIERSGCGYVRIF